MYRELRSGKYADVRHLNCLTVDGANIDDAAPTAAHHPPCGILGQFNHRTNIQIEVPVVGVIDTFEEGTTLNSRCSQECRAGR